MEERHGWRCSVWLLFGMQAQLQSQTATQRYMLNTAEQCGRAPRPPVHPCPPLGRRRALLSLVSAAAAGMGRPCPWPAAPACRQRRQAAGRPVSERRQRRAGAAGRARGRRVALITHRWMWVAGSPEHGRSAAPRGNAFRRGGCLRLERHAALQHADPRCGEASKAFGCCRVGRQALWALTQENSSRERCCE